MREVLPILIAVRKNKLKKIGIISDIRRLNSENKSQLFNSKEKLTEDLEKELINFFNESGLKEIFQDKSVKSIVDYVFGVEVGMDTNARKNRTGRIMEQIIQRILENIAENEEIEIIPQATQEKVKIRWNRTIKMDKTKRRFDFAVFNKKKNKIFAIEVNFYNVGGSKLKSTAGEYKGLFDFLKEQNVELIWITDGFGWKSTSRALYETFSHNDFLLNLELIKQGALKEILL